MFLWTLRWQLIEINLQIKALCILHCWCRVPSWRRRLTCSICGSSGAGACIRCEMPRCDTAFHVTCAQRAGVYMRLEMSRGVGNCSRAAPPRRTVFCDLHRPVKTGTISNLSLSASNGNNPLPKTPVKITDCLKTPKKARKLSCDEISEIPGVSSSGIAPQRYFFCCYSCLALFSYHFISYLSV